MPGDPDAIKPELVEAEKVVGDRASINFCAASKYCPVPTTPCTMPFPTLTSTQDVLGSCAAGAGCHGSTAPLKGPLGSALVLRDPDGGVPAAITRLVGGSVVATETAVGPDPIVPARSSKDVFGVNMPFIDGTSKNPGNSFLLYKIILGTPPRCGHLDEESPNPALASYACTAAAGQLETDEFLCTGIQCMPDAAAPRPDGGPAGQAGQPAKPIVPAWVPDDRWKPPAAGEYDRLRSRIRGGGMPPSPAVTPFQQARAISAWIAAGAPVTCPP
jgi:hypothetical protein